MLYALKAGQRDGRYRYHPLQDGKVQPYPYIYFYKGDCSWNLRAKSGKEDIDY